MTKKKKVWLVVSAIIVVALIVLCYIFLIKPALMVHKLEKLQAEEGPSAKYLSLMPQTDEIFGWAQELTEMGPRRVGTEIGRKAQSYVKEKLESFGMENVEIVQSDTTLWNCNEWKLTVAGEEISSYFMTHTFNDGSFGRFSTPEGGLEAEIVYVGDGDKKDFKDVNVSGKIVMANVKFMKVPVGLVKLASFMTYDPGNTAPFFSTRINPYSPNTYPYNYFNAMENGAVGFIGILSDYIDSNEYNNEDYSYLGDHMRLPALWVTQKDANKIIGAIDSGGGAAEAILDMDIEISQVKGGAVVGLLPGNSDETIIVQSHYDSSTPGAVEDASGTAAVLALAKFYSQIPASERDRSLLFVLMDTHFTDYESHEAFNDKYLNEGHKILADVCIEHIANELVEEDGELILTGHVEPRIIFTSEVDALIDITSEEIIRHGLGRSLVVPADLFGDDPPCDATMVFQEGVPIINLISGPIYLYDNIDTVDKIAKEELRPTVEAFSDIVWRLMELPIESFAE